MALLARLAHEEGLGVAAVLHQPDLARRHADRVIGLLHGRVAFDTGSLDVSDEAIDALYAPEREGAAA